MSRPDTTTRAVQNHRCPRCKAEPGQLCAGRRRVPYGVHAGRLLAATKAEGRP